MSGPLTGYTILELAGIGPGPFAGMLLADMGAEVIRIDRPSGNPMAKFGHAVAFRNRKNICLDLKSTEGAKTFLQLCEKADAVFEGFRPGVAEKLGIGPEDVRAINPKIVYGRMTGWGQDGPLAQAAGHDINYIALSGALAAIGRAGEKPVPPLNLVGDFGGGSLYLVMGMLAALLEAQKSGQGQVVDAAMIDGASSLMSMFHSFYNEGLHSLERGSNMLDGGEPIYDCYETSDAKSVSIASLEPAFYAELSERLKLPVELFGQPHNAKTVSQRHEYLTQLFKTKTRDQWCELLEGTDVCFAPVLDISEAPQHPHHISRKSFVEVGGMIQPAPAPRFSRSQAAQPKAAGALGENTTEVLAQFGVSEQCIDSLITNGAAWQA